ncbi:MAG: RsfS/YbeB/iojap family protein, partial [Phycisphaerales bacterium]|nr:RsfS/YbeB/iojap family protein [Phycisphaerales bacterium]
VVDFVEIVVHLFEPEQRLYYDLELLYNGSKKVEWRR